MTAGVRSTSSRRLIFGGLDSSLVNWDEFVHYQMRANVIYAEAGRHFNISSNDVLMNAQCPHEWRSTLKSAVFGSN